MTRDHRTGRLRASGNQVYLAGPGVFRPDANSIGRELKEICVRHGLEGLWPGDNMNILGSDMAVELAFIQNRDMLRSSAAIIADISPFRGPHMDPGTAFEIGLAYQAGIPVFAFTTATRRLSRDDVAPLPSPLVDRVKSRRFTENGVGFIRFPRLKWWEERVEDTGCLRDEDGNLVEDFGLVENLMVARALKSVSISPEEAIRHCIQYLDHEVTGRAHG